MSSPIEIHPEAAAEVQAAYAWYQQRNPSVAAAFLAEIDRAVSQISESPDRWPRFKRGTRRFVLHKFPFLVVYRKSGGMIRLFRLSRGAYHILGDVMHIRICGSQRGRGEAAERDVRG
jgi:plasmid stabilization system protein ParE